LTQRGAAFTHRRAWFRRAQPAGTPAIGNPAQNQMTARPPFFDPKSKAIRQYRKLADWATINAGRMTVRADRDWFLSLARTMTALADALELQQLGDSNSEP
jgi:hypothetical protein